MSTQSTPRLARSWNGAESGAPVVHAGEPDLSAKALGLRHLAAKNARIKAEQDKLLLAVRATQGEGGTRG